jgi:small subunit ribosomal protein S15
MALDRATKAEIIQEYNRVEGDTGSTEVQVALMTRRIQDLTEYFKIQPKDIHSRRGLQMLVNQRRKLLSYLKRTDLPRYMGLIQKLSIRDSY